MTVRLDTRKLDMIIAQLPARAEATVRGGAIAVEVAAIVRAPVDTGALVNSITVTSKGKLVWWVHDGVEYGIFQELGTSRMAAQPFMAPAVEEVRPRYNELWRSLFAML